ncbi:MAG: hypothetical protein A2283_10265 [Lentisphaerae bacterium RIFOXYA12_FULL_48_11]|nr:MAG: hypothetical protein A2283_10265 [Lentisphaerae bacterium RIFOXYA12_FULL_48_11]
MSKSLSKNALIAEIAAATNLDKSEVADVLNKLTEITYREAINGFVIPGICKLKVVTKKASRCRNPATGQMLLIGERQILKAIPISKAKEIITPKIENLIQVIADAPPPVEKKPTEEKKPVEEQPKNESVVHKMPEGAVPPSFPDLPATSLATPTEKLEPPSSQPDSSSSLSLGGDGGQIVFNCISCGTMLAAPPTSAGSTCTCPFCSVMNLIPSRKTDSGSTAGTKSDTDKKSEAPPKTGADFVTFVCQTCGQEIEAPIDMMGMDATCPTCASSLHVPASFTAEAPDEPVAKPAVQPVPGTNMSSMTIRIDLSDLE